MPIARPRAARSAAALLLALSLPAVLPAAEPAAVASPSRPVATSVVEGARPRWPRLPSLGRRGKARPAAEAPPASTASPASPTPQATTPARARRDSADPRRGFADSWFWGAKGGVMRFGTVTEGMVAAPTMGGDWLITRSRTALLVNADVALFNRTSGLASTDTGWTVLPVTIRNARRFGATILAAPVQLGGLRPYGGIGVVLEIVDGARAATGGTPARPGPGQPQVDAARSRASMQALAGAQYQIGRAAAFVQGTTVPARAQGFLLNYGQSAIVEVGLRINLSPAVDRF